MALFPYWYSLMRVHVKLFLRDWLLPEPKFPDESNKRSGTIFVVADDSAEWEMLVDLVHVAVGSNDWVWNPREKGRKVFVVSVTNASIVGPCLRRLRTYLNWEHYIWVFWVRVACDGGPLDYNAHKWWYEGLVVSKQGLLRTFWGHRSLFEPHFNRKLSVKWLERSFQNRWCVPCQIEVLIIVFALMTVKEGVVNRVAGAPVEVENRVFKVL